MPLTLMEVQHYVQHRLLVAGCSRPVFTDAALKKLFMLSGGIPRLVNLICDRALLGGYSQQKALIDATLVQQAAGEILAIRQAEPAKTAPWWLWAGIFVLCVTLGVLLTLGFSTFISE
jgi:general secretion pathway protein A